MQDNNEDRRRSFELLREIVEDFQRRGRSTYPAGVKSQLQRRGIEEGRLGYGSFAEFVAAAEEAGWIVRARDAAGRTMLEPPESSDAEPPAFASGQAPFAARRLRHDLWSAFVDWRESTRVYDRRRGRAFRLPAEPQAESPELAAVREAARAGEEQLVPIEPIGMDEQRTWMASFVEKQEDHPLSEALRMALKSERPFQAFNRILQIDAALQDAFREQRLGNVAAAVLSWMEKHGVQLEPWETVHSPVDPRPAEQGAADLDQLRSAAHRAVDRMSADELLRLSLPLGYVVELRR